MQPDPKKLQAWLARPKEDRLAARRMAVRFLLSLAKSYRRQEYHDLLENCQRSLASIRYKTNPYPY